LLAVFFLAPCGWVGMCYQENILGRSEFFLSYPRPAEPDKRGTILGFAVISFEQVEQGIEEIHDDGEQVEEVKEKLKYAVDVLGLGG
jgi:hypothetical protein